MHLFQRIKTKVQKALIGLEGDGLTIEQRNGKIYISLEEALLFDAGKYVFNQSGIDALNKLSLKGNVVVLATAHPAKFPKVVIKQTNIKPKLPKSLKNIFNKKEIYKKLPKIVKNQLGFNFSTNK